MENAVKHGLEPKIEGGEVTVRVRNQQGRMLISVEDDGLGFKPGNQPGVGLANLRERLNVLYDGQASVKVFDRLPGTQVLIDLPIAQAAGRTDRKRD